MTDILEISLDLIEVADRAREDYGDLQDLADNISKHGLLQPITVRSQPGERPYRLLAGGRRYFAHGIAGLPTVAAILRHGVSDADALEIELIENVYRKDLTWQERAALYKKIYERKPDYQRSLRETGKMLGVSHEEVRRSIEVADALEKIPELKKYGVESDAWKALARLKEGVAIQELQRRAKERTEQAIQEAHEAGTEIDLPEELKLFKWADDSYIVGDTLTGMAAMFGSELFDFAEVDPPYGIDLDQLKRVESSIGNLDYYKEVAKLGYDDFIAEVAGNVRSLLSENAFCIWWFGPTHYHMVRETLRRVGFSLSDVPAIWYKGNQGQTQQPDVNLANCYEMFFVARKGQPVLRKSGRSNVFHYPPVVAQKKIHATEKPIELMVELLETCALPASRILVPFAGSGVTLRAAKKLDMDSIGWDLSKEMKGSFMLKVQEDASGQEV